MPEYMISQSKLNFIKPFINKLMDHYDVSEQFADRIEFYGAVMNTMVESEIDFLFADRVIVYYEENGARIEIYKLKDSDPIVYNIKEKQ